MGLDTWFLEEQQFNEENLASSESLFSLGNGYLGFRGFFCEREPAHHPGVFINGFYELSPISYGEDAYGFARYNQTMVDLPDCRYTCLSVDGQPFSITSNGIESYHKQLNFKTGILSQTVQWRTANNKLVTIKWETIISMEHIHTGALHIHIQCDQKASIEFHSSIAMPKQRPLTALDPRVGTVLSNSSLICIDSAYSAIGSENQPGFQATFKTEESALYLACGAVHDCSVPTHIERYTEDTGELPALRFSAEVQDAHFYKCFYYHSSGRPNEHLPLEVVRESKIKKGCLNWEELVASQEAYFSQFWQKADIEIVGNEKLQQALRFNLFQLHQSTGRDGMSSLAAKGLTGSGYEGHYFWDTEIYGMPFFSHTDPSTARALITYRISLLDHARSRAREMSQRGALYPWRTINGLEASAYFPAGTAQYHINADIAYSIFQYLDITGDETILEEGAAAVLFETARLWYDLGYFNPRRGGQFCIHEVTGPDEYSALVNNNVYTNSMAKYHLERVCALANHLQTTRPKFWETLRHTIKLEENELDGFNKAANAMYIPFDAELGINPQDDSFLQREIWDVSKRGELRHPMLLNYHPLVIYRHRVIKQADGVLAMFLLHDRFPWYLRKRNFDFYEPFTTGDSSLSACIQGIVAFDCGYVEKGLDYSLQSALMDIEDLHRNTKDGLHTAAMAGSWMTIVYGLAGYRLLNKRPTFRPVLPKGWQKMSFAMVFGKITLHISIEAKQTTYRAKGGELEIAHRSTLLTVGSTSVIVPTKPSCKAVVFDLDGVVTSTDAYHYLAWKRLSDEQGWKFNPEVNQRLRGISRIQSLQVILDYNEVSLPDEDIKQLAEQKNTWYRSSLTQLSYKDILPGIVEILDTLKKQGIKTAIASASRNALYILEQIELSEFFDVIVPSEDVGVGKPDPEIFARAAFLLGLYPEECTGVEDAPPGITAIKAAMMRSVGVGSAIDPESCDVYVDSTANLTAEMLLF